MEILLQAYAELYGFIESRDNIGCEIDRKEAAAIQFSQKQMKSITHNGSAGVKEIPHFVRDDKNL